VKYSGYGSKTINNQYEFILKDSDDEEERRSVSPAPVKERPRSPEQVKKRSPSPQEFKTEEERQMEFVSILPFNLCFSKSSLFKQLDFHWKYSDLIKFLKEIAMRRSE
jgi:hypothetical protein